MNIENSKVSQQSRTYDEHRDELRGRKTSSSRPVDRPAASRTCDENRTVDEDARREIQAP